MFDVDGDGDIDQFDEELIEYDLQLEEDMWMAEEFERERQQNAGSSGASDKSCLNVLLIALGLLVLILAILGM
jgi:hypothetical protein